MQLHSLHSSMYNRPKKHYFLRLGMGSGHTACCRVSEIPARIKYSNLGQSRILHVMKRGVERRGVRFVSRLKAQQDDREQAAPVIPVSTT